MQCTSNSYISVNLVIKNISIWKSLGLDYILKQGERIFRLVCVSQSLAVDDFPFDIIIDDHSVSKKTLVHESNLFAERNDSLESYRRYSESERDNGVIFMCRRSSIAIIGIGQFFFIFVIHRRNTAGFRNPKGKVVLLKRFTMSYYKYYIKTFGENNVSCETQYDLHYISVKIVEASKIGILDILRRKREAH